MIDCEHKELEDVYTRIPTIMKTGHVYTKIAGYKICHKCLMLFKMIPTKVA